MLTNKIPAHQYMEEAHLLEASEEISNSPHCQCYVTHDIISVMTKTIEYDNVY